MKAAQALVSPLRQMVGGHSMSSKAPSVFLRL